MDTNTLLWVVAGLMIVVGVAGVVLPALPGVLFVLAGIVLAAWIDDFTRISGWTVGIIAVLAVVGWVADYAATLLGAKKAGASKLAIAGAAIGTVLGVFAGLIGLLIFPFIGAALGEYLHQRDARNAGKVGLGTWLGLLVGTVVKVVIVFMMLGIFIAALLIQ
jgi:uncharacterized protein YqgC (DUF456 family)